MKASTEDQELCAQILNEVPNIWAIAQSFKGSLTSVDLDLSWANVTIEYNNGHLAVIVTNHRAINGQVIKAHAITAYFQRMINPDHTRMSFGGTLCDLNSDLTDYLFVHMAGAVSISPLVNKLGTMASGKIPVCGIAKASTDLMAKLKLATKFKGLVISTMLARRKNAVISATSPKVCIKDLNSIPTLTISGRQTPKEAIENHVMLLLLARDVYKGSGAGVSVNVAHEFDSWVTSVVTPEFVIDMQNILKITP